MTHVYDSYLQVVTRAVKSEIVFQVLAALSLGLNNEINILIKSILSPGFLEKVLFILGAVGC